MIAIHISGIHCHVPDGTKAYITDKLGNLDRFHPRLHALHVTIHAAEKDGCRVDLVMHLHSGKEVVAHHVEKSTYAAIDGVAAKCASQLRRIHDRERGAQRQRTPIPA